MKSSTLIWSAAGLALLSFASFALFKAWPVLFPKADVSVPLDPACDLRAGPCVSPLATGGSVSFSVEPRSIPVMKPLKLQVQVVGLDVREVSVDFSGVDMNMGYNRARLKAQNDNAYQGEGMLPVCVRDAMEWEAQVLIQTNDGLISAPYRFITVKSSLP